MAEFALEVSGSGIWLSNAPCSAASAFHDLHFHQNPRRRRERLPQSSRGPSTVWTRLGNNPYYPMVRPSILTPNLWSLIRTHGVWMWIAPTGLSI